MQTIKRTLVIPLLLTLAFSSLGADTDSRKIQDDSPYRLSLRASWFTEVPNQVIHRSPERHTLTGGDRIETRVEMGRDEFSIVLARELNGAYPGWAQGSWVLTRNLKDGAPSRIRVFLRSDPFVYVQFRPLDEGRSQMDAVVYDAYLVRSRPIPVPFERLMALPVEEALTLAGASFPRRYFDPFPGQYRDMRSLVFQIRERLPGLSFRDDGALDENGEYVYINSLQAQEGKGGLNCSGFAKWVVDGILWPITEGYLPIESLKAPYGDRGGPITEPYEETRAPFFGLDWTRNLAAQANRILRSPAFGAVEEIEIRRAPFSSTIVRRGNAPGISRPYPGFLLNAGFGIEGLQALLYTLAIDEPGRIYLASVNTEMDPAPRMRQHFHVAVLVPYFDEFGVFKIDVFESAEETAFRAFRNRYPGHYVNLTRIPIEGMFIPKEGESYRRRETPEIPNGQNLFFYGIKR